MTPLPLRRVLISNFRRIGGSWEVPLDAPIVLIHGANGSGKTSVLSALEFGLTGAIRAMRRQDVRYTAHLPHRGSSFATIGVEIADDDGRVHLPPPITVGGDEIKGPPALDPETGQFFAERAYLDQVSLGQLLDLYQYREGNQESALARFVNELLGLDQLDALRSGLHDATDLRRLRNLSNFYADAESQVTWAETEIDRATGELSQVDSQLGGIRERLRPVLAGFDLATTLPDSGGDLEDIETQLVERDQTEAHAEAEEHVRALTELRGRIRGLAQRPSAARLNDARASVAAANEAVEEWRASYEGPIESLRDGVAALGLGSDPTLQQVLAEETRTIELRIAEHSAAVAQLDVDRQNVANLQRQLESVNTEISARESRAGTLATGLAAIRDQASENICPVCDRDFSEVSAGHLLEHIDQKIADLTGVGAEIQSLSDERTQLTTRLRAAQQGVSVTEAAVLTEAEHLELTARHIAVSGLLDQAGAVAHSIARGQELRAVADSATRELASIEAEDREQQAVGAELTRLAAELGTTESGPRESPEEAWSRLHELASSRSQEISRHNRSLSEARGLLRQLRDSTERSTELAGVVTAAARSKRVWEQRIGEANRRREVARSVHKAASDTRTAIVQRVFTQSLNDVWRDVFSRLAPAEPFVPAFGNPTTTRTALELRLETVHKAGGTAGTPSMMLSTGNLNTAALSLFIALHLAVEPKFPCLVLDDPVQSMDEVHIAQFAGLLRVLSKRHERQIVLAVHERELFDYLALELSPAFDGDELITVELGLDPDGQPTHLSTRLAWAEDEAFAV